MLNEEALLIKAAQYLDLDLVKLKIKESSRKNRFINRELTLEEFEHVKKKIYNEFHSLGFSTNIYRVLEEFLESYNYITQELYSAYDPLKEKEYNWLLLKHFVIPFFAFKVSQSFGDYNNRLDKGLAGGDFWFFPEYQPKKKKLIFPLNKLMQWLIDLSGKSANAFYYSFSDANLTDHTLKKWHTTFTVPNRKSIEEFSNALYPFKNIFTKRNYQDALDFVKSLSLSTEDLKKEIPNYNNILDKIEQQKELSQEEQERFILYIQERWVQPTPQIIKFVCLSARISHQFYKEINEYFQSTKDEQLELHKNSALQLFIFFQELYNATLAYQTKKEINQFHRDFLFDYLNLIAKFKTKPKEACDEIVAAIFSELQLQKNIYMIDEILIKYINNDMINAKQRLHNQNRLKREKKEQNKKIYKAISFLKKPYTTEQKLAYIFNIYDSTVLHNIGDYFQGNNYLTDEKSMIPQLELALSIHIHNYRIAYSAKERGFALTKVVNLLTFPLYPKFLDADEVEKYMAELEKYIEDDIKREKFIFLTFEIYHAIKSRNNTKVKKLTKEFLKEIKPLEIDTYNPQVLFVSQDYIGQYINDISLYNKLQKHNQKEPLYQQHQSFKFFFYT